MFISHGNLFGKTMLLAINMWSLETGGLGDSGSCNDRFYYSVPLSSEATLSMRPKIFSTITHVFLWLIDFSLLPKATSLSCLMTGFMVYHHDMLRHSEAGCLPHVPTWQPADWRVGILQTYHNPIRACNDLRYHLQCCTQWQLGLHDTGPAAL